MVEKRESDFDSPKYMPKTNVGRIASQFKYVLHARAITRFILGADGSTATIAGLIEHVKDFDEDGYHPPKSFVMDGMLEDRIDELLEHVDLGDEWEFAGFDDGYERSLTVDTVYVFDSELKGAITREDLRGHRWSWIEAALKKKRRKRSRGEDRDTKESKKSS
jgi:hypothetical protein